VDAEDPTKQLDDFFGLPNDERIERVGFQPLQLEEVRARIRKMSDQELIRFGRAAALSAGGSIRPSAAQSFCGAATRSTR